MTQLKTTAKIFGSFLKKANGDISNILNILNRVLRLFKTFSPELTAGIQEVQPTTINITREITQTHISFLIDVDADQYQNLLSNTELKNKLILHFENNLQRSLGILVKVSFNYFPV